MRLRILTRLTGTINGVSLESFTTGEVYDVGADLGAALLSEGWAEIVSAEPLVLVVDDEPEVRRLAEALLTAHGYQVMVAAHGQDAIQRLREQCPDLIVLDLNMPVMDGWQFRTEQRYFLDKKRSAVPVVLMTGLDDAAAHADTLRAVGVIKKPIDLDDLLDAVSAAIGSQGSAPDGIRSTRPWKRTP